MNQFNGIQPQYQPSNEDDEFMSAVNEYRQEKFQPHQPVSNRPVFNQNTSQQLPNHPEAQQAINTLNKLWEQGQAHLPNAQQPSHQNTNTSISPFEFSFMVNGVPVTVRIG